MWWGCCTRWQEIFTTVVGDVVGRSVAVRAFDPRRLAGALLGPSKAELKAQLLQAIEGTNKGADATVEQAMAVDEAAAALESKGSSGRPTTGPLSGEWELVYTTESDVHAFLQRKVLVRASSTTHPPPGKALSQTGEQASERLAACTGGERQALLWDAILSATGLRLQRVLFTHARRRGVAGPAGETRVPEHRPACSAPHQWYRAGGRVRASSPSTIHSRGSL
jgi:hypothetical protein